MGCGAEEEEGKLAAGRSAKKGKGDVRNILIDSFAIMTPPRYRPHVKEVATMWQNLMLIGLAAMGTICMGCPEPKDADQDRDGTPDAEDCADQDPAINRGALELCDGVDQDCDGQDDCLAKTRDQWEIRGAPGTGFGASVAIGGDAGAPQLYVGAPGVAPTSTDLGAQGERTSENGRLYRFDLTALSTAESLAPAATLTGSPGDMAGWTVAKGWSTKKEVEVLYVSAPGAFDGAGAIYEVPIVFASGKLSEIGTLKVDGRKRRLLGVASIGSEAIAGFRVMGGRDVGLLYKNPDDPESRCLDWTDGQEDDAPDCKFCWKDRKEKGKYVIDTTIGHLLSDDKVDVIVGHRLYSDRQASDRGRVMVFTDVAESKLCDGTVLDPERPYTDPTITLKGDGSEDYLGSDLLVFEGKKDAFMTVAAIYAQDRRGTIYVLGRKAANSLASGRDNVSLIKDSHSAMVIGPEPVSGSNQGSNLGIALDIKPTFARGPVIVRYSGGTNKAGTVSCASQGLSNTCQVGLLGVSFELNMEWDYMYDENVGLVGDGPPVCGRCDPGGNMLDNQVITSAGIHWEDNFFSITQLATKPNILQLTRVTAPPSSSGSGQR